MEITDRPEDIQTIHESNPERATWSTQPPYAFEQNEDWVQPILAAPGIWLMPVR